MANFVRQKPDNDEKGGNNKTRVKMYQTTVKEKQKVEKYTDTIGRTQTELVHPILLKNQINRCTAYSARRTVIILANVRLINTQEHSRNNSVPNITHVMLV